jgi:branched-chain amino acid aminotransferase
MSDLGFGRYFADHMFLMDYTPELGWNDPRIVPYGPFTMQPANLTLHYGQAIFEGMKAFRRADGSVHILRPALHMERFIRSAERLCMPTFDTDFMVGAIAALVDIDRDWVPSQRGTALYIRPTMIAADNMLGVRPSRNYKMFVITSPVGAYYAGGMKPIRIFVEELTSRAAEGGLGEAKTAANYAASLLTAERAKKNGFDQVLWLDASEHLYIEEVGTMNIFFVIDGVLVTPPLDGTILSGITRQCVIEIARGTGIPFEERRISMPEVAAAHRDGKLQEAFGSGTAAVIAPIGELYYQGESFMIEEQENSIRDMLYRTISGIQYGEIPDTYGWMMEVGGVEEEVGSRGV